MTDDEPSGGMSVEGPKSDPPDPLEIPTDPEVSYPICGSPRRQGDGAPCTRPAGLGTDHVGEGRCKLHGGSNPIKSGRYSV